MTDPNSRPPAPVPPAMQIVRGAREVELTWQDQRERLFDLIAEREIADRPAVYAEIAEMLAEGGDEDECDYLHAMLAGLKALGRIYEVAFDRRSSITASGWELETGYRCITANTVDHVRQGAHLDRYYEGEHCWAEARENLYCTRIHQPRVSS